MLLSKVFPIHVTLWNGIIGINAQSSVSNLNWEPVLKIQKANLTNIFQLTASLANLGLLISCITTRSPPEHREGPGADFALLIIISLCLHQIKSSMSLRSILPTDCIHITITFKYSMFRKEHQNGHKGWHRSHN